jgi:ubiquinone/menaquinone biosynthesis C-methylase UbiE
MNRLFKSIVEYYSVYRPGAPIEVVEYLRDRYRLTGSERLLDLGCGTGQATFALAPYFCAVDAFDSDPDMIEAARKRSTKEKTAYNINWFVRPGEDISPELGPYRMIIACRSFHWMDQYKVLNNAKTVLSPGGIVAILGDGSLWTGNDDWQKTVKSVIQEFLGEARKARQGPYNASTEPYENMLRKCGYQRVSVFTLHLSRSWTFETLLGYLYSTTFAAPDLFGERIDQFEHVLFQSLGNPEKDTLFVENVEFTIKTGVWNLEGN